MEKICKCEYSSLSCFLQLSDIDEISQEPTTSRDDIFRDVSVLNLYYDILRKVEKDPFKYWNIYALRNYLWYFYKLSKYMSDSISDSSAHSKSGPNPLNIYAKSDFAIFFTGLYSKYRNKGCKEGLFIVCQRQDDNKINRRVMTYSQLRNSDLKKCLDNLAIKSTFEEYYYSSLDGVPQTIKTIENLSKFDYENYEKNDQNKYIDTRLHILIDGVDNIPNDFFRIIYGIDPNKYKSISLNNKKKVVYNSVKKKCEQFLAYQDAMIDAIEEAIKKAQNDNKFNQLPLNFYYDPKKAVNPFQYLLPIDFTGTGNPDFCACISVDKEGTGRLKTILNINEVYGNVRVFGMDAVESVKDWWV